MYQINICVNSVGAVRGGYVSDPLCVCMYVYVDVRFMKKREREI